MAVIALVAVVIGIWRFIPQRSTESTSEPTSEAVESSDSTGSVTGTPRVAVLPFQSLTGQANDDSFNRSLTEALFAALSKRSEVRVVSAAAVQRYLEAGASDPVTAGHELGAQMMSFGAWRNGLQDISSSKPSSSTHKTVARSGPPDLTAIPTNLLSFHRRSPKKLPRGPPLPNTAKLIDSSPT